jgi:hypothetical protein
MATTETESTGASTGVGKLKRSYLLHYIDTTMGSNTPKWFLIGKDIEDMSVELNPDTETVKNIWDETVTHDNGYEPSVSAETYYADTNDDIYEKLRDIAMNRLTGDDCKTKILEVVMDTKSGPYKAWQEDCFVKPQSYGGSQGGVNIPYNISFCGNREAGTATITKKVPTFTAKSST